MYRLAGALSTGKLSAVKLKLDLHPIYDDSRAIEDALAQIVADAVQKRATEVEIIPGKGSGALKKTVIRFLDRPDIKACYHRLEKDGDNWGRLFVHFRHERLQEAKAAPVPREAASFACFCCAASVVVPIDRDALPTTLTVECPACASPNKAALSLDRRGAVQCAVEPGYE